MLCGIPIITADCTSHLQIGRVGNSIVCSACQTWTRLDSCSVQSLTLAANIFVICKTKDWGNKLTTAAAAQKRASGTHNCCIKIAFHLPQNEAIVGRQWHATGSSLLCSHRRCDADVKLRMCGASFVSPAFLPLSGQKAQQPQLLNMPHSDRECAHTHTHTHAKQNM